MKNIVRGSNGRHEAEKPVAQRAARRKEGSSIKVGELLKEVAGPVGRSVGVTTAIVGGGLGLGHLGHCGYGLVWMIVSSVIAVIALCVINDLPVRLFHALAEFFRATNWVREDPRARREGACYEKDEELKRKALEKVIASAKTHDQKKEAYQLVAGPRAELWAATWLRDLRGVSAAEDEEHAVEMAEVVLNGVMTDEEASVPLAEQMPPEPLDRESDEA